MPPKKKDTSKKKSKKKGSDSSDGAGLAPEDKVKHLECQLNALQVQLAARLEEANSNADKRDDMQRQLNETTEMHQEEKETYLAVTRDMTRQYKAMQEQLLNKINTRENTIQNLRDELERMKKAHSNAMEDKDGIIGEKNAHIKALEDKMEDLCINFSNMLSESLMKMNGLVAAHFTACDVNATGLEEQLRLIYEASIRVDDNEAEVEGKEGTT